MLLTLLSSMVFQRCQTLADEASDWGKVVLQQIFKPPIRIRTDGFKGVRHQA